jgi:predicted metal-binding protein
MRQALSSVLETGKGAGIELLPTECLSGCKRGCTVAVEAAGKWSYVIADLDPEKHATGIVTFAEQYAAQPDGVPIWRERPEIIKRSVLAGIPPLPVKMEDPNAP